MSNLTLVTKRPPMKEPDLTYIIKAQVDFDKAFTAPPASVYVTLVEEEHEEWVEEYYSTSGREFDELKELADVLYVTAGLYHQLGYKQYTTLMYNLTKDDTWDMAISKLTEQVSLGNKTEKILRQLMYCCFAYAEAMGWDLTEAYRRVHLSNMSKLGDDGKPVRREDGKILKGQNYKPPYLEDLTNGA